MTKDKYLALLREELSYELPGRLVEKNIRFYEDYFAEQAKAGKSTEEIEAELGDPKLIAKSCIEAEKSGEDGIPNSEDDPDFSKEIAGEEAGNRNGNQNSSSDAPSGFHSLSGKGCLIIAVIVLILIIAFFLTPFGSKVLSVLFFALLLFALYRYFKRG